MRKIILLILFIFCTLPIFAEKVIYLDKNSDKQASKLLYEYELKDLNTTPEKANEVFGFSESDVRAVFYDLNSDGVNEIIGYINSNYYYGVLGWQLFILQKRNNEYVNISSVNFYPKAGLHILKDSKLFGYYALGYYEGVNLVYKTTKYHK